MGYSTKSILLLGVKKGNLASFPDGITVQQINRYFTTLEPSIKEYLMQERQDVQSTKVHTITSQNLLFY